MSSAKLSLADYDPKDPDPWLALNLDKTLPIAPAAKEALLRDNASSPSFSISWHRAGRTRPTSFTG